MMEKEEILFWRDKYDKEEDLYNKGDESSLRRKFQKNCYMGKGDLERIVKWKFQGRLKGRQKRTLNLLQNVKDDFIIDISKLAFRVDSDEERIKLLSSIRGVGNALSSVILTFFDPQNYGILDIHSWRELFKEKEPVDVFSNPKQAAKFFRKLRSVSAGLGLSCRDVEKAMFKKNLDESKEKVKIG